MPKAKASQVLAVGLHVTWRPAARWALAMASPALWNEISGAIRVQPGKSSTSRLPAGLRFSYLTTVRTGGEPGRSMGAYDPNFAHRPSEMTSTVPSTTLTAVCSSMA